MKSSVVNENCRISGENVYKAQYRVGRVHSWTAKETKQIRTNPFLRPDQKISSSSESPFWGEFNFLFFQFWS